MASSKLSQKVILFVDVISSGKDQSCFPNSENLINCCQVDESPPSKHAGSCFLVFLLWYRSVRAAWLLLHTLDKMLWAKGQFFMLQHIHYFLASIFRNTNPSRLYLEILRELYLSQTKAFLSNLSFPQIFTTLLPDPILLWGYWSL